MTSYSYDGANAVQEVIGGTNTANSLSGGIDEVFQRTDSAGARNFLTDALGSTLALADSTGAVQTQYTFEPFGNATQSGSSTTNSFAYTGRELDATGLYFYRARYYNPQTGRFTRVDPASFLPFTSTLVLRMRCSRLRRFLSEYPAFDFQLSTFNLPARGFPRPDSRTQSNQTFALTTFP